MTITASLFEAFLKCPTKCWLRATNEPPTGNTYAEWVKTQNKSYRATETERLIEQTPPDDCALSPPVENLKAAKWLLATDVLVQMSELPRSSRREEAPSENAELGVRNAELSQSLATSAATAQTSTQPGQSPSQRSDGTLAPPLAPVGTDSTPSHEFQGRGWNASLPGNLESRLHAVERVSSEGRGKAAQFIPIRFIFFNKLTKDDKLLLAFDAFAESRRRRRRRSPTSEPKAPPADAAAEPSS